MGTYDLYNQSITDEALLKLIAQSDERAFEEIYKRYWKQVFRYIVVKIQSQSDAEDICHDIFLSLWQKRMNVSINHLEAYLIQAARYSTIRFIQTNLLHNKHLKNILDSSNPDNYDTENSLAFHALQKALEEAIEKLPHKTAEIFRLSKMYGLKNREIADRLKISEKVVEYHITRSLKMMRLELKDFYAFIFLFFDYLF